jgi:hypothetical protein
VEGDGAARRSISAVELEQIAPAAAAAGGWAHRAVRYESGDAFFLDENAYAEPTGFWVAGGRAAQILIVNDRPNLDLFVRNAPVDNTVTIEIGGERHAMTLRPGEERTVSLPRAGPGPHAAVRITSQNGFRPSAIDPANGDLRYLGCWVETR